MKKLSKYFHRLLDFIYPNLCLLCESELLKEDNLVCDSCWQRLPAVNGTVSEGLVAFDAIDEIRAGYYYDDDFKVIIHHLKYHGYTRLAERISQRLHQILVENAHWLYASVLVPVPMHHIKLRERGYNQAAEIARALSRIIGIRCREDVLERRANSVSQTRMMDASDRVDNLQNVFHIRTGADVTGQAIILVDDVITTGATANACARVLKRAGANSIRVLTAGRPYFVGTAP